VWDTLFYVNGSLDSERPEPISEVGVDEHSARHATNCQVATLGDAVLGGGVGYGFFEGNTVSLAINFHLAMDEFGGIVQPKGFNLLATESLGSGFKLNK
jgi:hypothetical protein